MTAKEFLLRRCTNHSEIETVYHWLNEFAKIMAIEFQKWIAKKEYYPHVDGSGIWFNSDGEDVYSSDEEIYEAFLNDTNLK